MTASKPWDWVEQINASIYEQVKRPLFSLPAPFELDLFEQKLSSVLQQPDLKISYQTKGWVMPEELWEAVGKPIRPLAIAMAPLEVPAYFVTTDHDLKQLMGELLGGEEIASFFYERDLADGFYHYFVTELLRILEEMQCTSPLVPRLGETVEQLEEMTSTEPTFVIDLALSIKEKRFWARILLPKKFKEAWERHFSHLPPRSLSEAMLKKISVDVALEIGYVELNLEEYKELHEGDFITLDHCSYDPEKGKGGVVLKLQEKPIFRGRFKEEGIKLTNYPIYEEVKEVVDKEILTPEEDNLYGDLEQTSEEEELPEEKTPEKPLFNPNELPVHLTVEVGSVRMTAQELMNLTPGSLLELGISVKEGVSLLVNGKKVGRGELIRVGEAIGVRILSL
ncbi:MAG: type III secretion system cytoplasmic ring protein SctQ [Chlamydiales bacterium]